MYRLIQLEGTFQDPEGAGVQNLVLIFQSCQCLMYIFQNSHECPIFTISEPVSYFLNLSVSVNFSKRQRRMSIFLNIQCSVGCSTLPLPGPSFCFSSHNHWIFASRIFYPRRNKSESHQHHSTCWSNIYLCYAYYNILGDPVSSRLAYGHVINVWLREIWDRKLLLAHLVQAMM